MTCEIISHVPVMPREVVAWMNLHPGGVYVDGTCGGGGHSEAMLEYCPGIRLLALDKDEDAVRIARRRLARWSGCEVIHAGYEELGAVLENLGITGVDGIVLDLGFSSLQVQDPARGFSFQLDGPLDMRFDRRSGQTAAEIVNRWRRQDLIRLFREYGEIPGPERLVNRIIERRKVRPFETTLDLAQVAIHSVRSRPGLHAATLVFQALRIAVNNELETIAAGLAAGRQVLKPSGRMVVISFHSLEDRIVKQTFRESSDMMVLTRKPVRAGADERAGHRESRSAKLRVAEKQ